MNLSRTFFCLLFSVVLAASSTAQSKDEKAVADVLLKNTSSFEKNDVATLDQIWANDEAVTVFENGYANYGWLDYRNNHLLPEMQEMKNLKYGSSDVKIKLSGKTAWATFKYTISGDMNGRHFDSGGLGTAILEKRDGRWQIVHWHTSAPRRPAAPATVKPSF
jgi:ketosteroid isomerase-like protein